MKMSRYIVYLTMFLFSIMWGQDCIDSVEVELWGECYFQSDIDFLQGFINNSQGSENPPDINMEPVNLGSQTWRKLGKGSRGQGDREGLDRSFPGREVG